IQPVVTDADIHDQRNGELGGVLHLVTNELAQCRDLVGRSLEYELVVHLENHDRARAAGAKRVVDAYHRDLDEIRSGALNGRVGGCTLTELAHAEVAIAELRDVSTPAEQRLHVPVLAREFDHRIQVESNAAEALEVLADESLRFGRLDAQLARQCAGTLSVNRREVDRLGARTHVRRHLFNRHVEDDRRRLSMDVSTGAEGVDECRVRGKMCEQPKLDLRIVGGDQLPPGTRDEAASDVSTELAPNWNVLKIWIARRQSPRAGDSLVERCVNTAVSWMHERGKRIEIRALELRQLTVFHEECRKRVALLRQLLKHGRIGGWSAWSPLEHGKLEFLEQNLTKLGIRVDVERLTRGLVNVLLYALPFALKPLFE